MPDRVTSIICALFSVCVCYLISGVNSRPTCGNYHVNKQQNMEDESERIISELNSLKEYGNFYREPKTSPRDEIDKLEHLFNNFSKSVDDQRKRWSELKGRLSVEQRNANQSKEWHEVHLEENKQKVNNLESKWRKRTLNKSRLSSDWEDLGEKAKKLASVQNQTRMSRNTLEGNIQNSKKELTQMKDDMEYFQDSSLKDEEKNTGDEQENIEQSIKDQDALEGDLRKLKRDLEELLPKKVEVVEEDVSTLCRRHKLD